MATVKKSIKAPAKKASSVNAATKTKNAAQISVSKAGSKSVKKEGSDKGIQKKTITPVKVKKSLAVKNNENVKKESVKKITKIKDSEKENLKKENAQITVEKKEELISTEKLVKVGVKTKKQLVSVAAQPVIKVSDYPKHKVKTLLISQPKPENDKNPYYDLAKKYNLIESFRQFIKIEGLSAKDFRTQKIDILEHKAVILTSKMAGDHYFRMCNEMRVTVPESMKYFCINEATAYYLQKYIQYRKRKIFFGHQTIQDLVDVIRKNREEKFLLPASDVHKEQICDFLDAINIKYTKAVMYRTVSADLSDIKNLNEFDVIAFFTPAGINSLNQNFPNFKQKKLNDWEHVFDQLNDEIKVIHKTKFN
jgi:uroporphyrinogen-III synthase